MVLSWIRLEHSKIWIRLVDDDVKAELHLLSEIINEKFQIGYQTKYLRIAHFDSSEVRNKPVIRTFESSKLSTIVVYHNKDCEELIFSLNMTF